MAKLLSMAAVLLLAVPCAGEVLTVDDDGQADFTTIQEAIDASWHGDTVIVRPGTYREQVRFQGRRIVVRSEDPDDPAVVQNTVISAESTGDASGASVRFDFGEQADSVLTGLTITDSGILCSGTSPTISGNVIRNCTGTGIRGQDNAAPTIRDNEILSNELEGIYACHGLIQGNTIADNSAGIAFCHGRILDNLVLENGDAGGIYSCNGEIADNRIVGNRAASDGGGLFGCDGRIHNNVIAGNRAQRDGGGLYDCSQDITGNTIVGNRAGDRGGGISDCAGIVANNIIAGNESASAAAIYGPCSNSYNAYWQNVPGNFGGGASNGVGDLSVDPLFVRDGHWDDNGTTDPADDFWVDGDFHLRSGIGRWQAQAERWVQDATTSRCIDAGKPNADWTAELWPHGKRINIGAYGGTPQASLSATDLGRPTDLDHNERIDPRDLKLLAGPWPVRRTLLAEDIDRNGFVDFNDFAALAQQWRVSPPVATAPLPDPMTWATRPYGTGPNSVAMVATTATSTDGTGVEYYFEDFYNPQFNSGWLYFGPDGEPRWEDTGLQPETLYWYRVKARNRGNRLETAWSREENGLTLAEDTEPPSPNPMTWATPPFGVDGQTIRMVATAATDDSDVEYQFECTSHPVYSSAWQDSPTYEVGPVPRGDYAFRVRARDKSPRRNETHWSEEVFVDLRPPTPDPMAWEVEPEEARTAAGTFGYGATMTAVEATDTAAGVEYFFECTTDERFSSGWQTERTYTVTIGRTGHGYRFRCRARDTSASGNQTAWSPELPAL